MKPNLSNLTLCASLLLIFGCGANQPPPASKSRDAVLLVRHEGKYGVLRDGLFEPLVETEDKEISRIALSLDGRRAAAITSENRIALFAPGKTDFLLLGGSDGRQSMRTAPNIFAIAWLPDEKKLLVQTNDTVFDLYDLKGEWVERLLDTSRNELSLRCPVWSPDGNKLAFIAGDDLWIADRKANSVRQLTFTRAVEDDPAWSADALWIYFSSDMDAPHIGRPDADFERDIYRVRPNGLNLKRLTTDRGEEARPVSCGPDEVLFARRGVVSGVLKLDVATGERTEIANGEFEPIGFIRL